VIWVLGKAFGGVEAGDLYAESSLFVHDDVLDDFDGPELPRDPDEGDALNLVLLDDAVAGEPVKVRLEREDTAAGEVDADYEGAFLIIVHDPQDENGDGETRYYFTAHMTRYWSEGITHTDLVFVLDGQVDVDVINVLTGESFAYTVDVTAASDTEEGDCQSQVGGPSKICVRDTAEIVWTAQQGSINYAASPSVTGDCIRPIGRCKKNGKTSATAKVRAVRKSGEAGDTVVTKAWVCCDDGEPGNGPPHQLTCISFKVSLPQTGSVQTGPSSTGSFGAGVRRFPDYSESNGRKVEVSVCAPAGCDTTVDLSFDGGDVGAEFKPEGGSWGDSSQDITGTGSADFRMRGNDEEGWGELTITIKDSSGNAVCTKVANMRAK